MRSLAFLLGALLALPQAAGQDLPALSESIDVRVTNVEVVVTDATGRRVTGLTADDFEVLEGGTAQQITNFSEYRDQAPPSAGPIPAGVPTRLIAAGERRRIVLFLDRVVLSDHQRRVTFDAYADLVTTLLREGDQAMIITWDTGMRIAADFTGDRRKLEGVLRAIGKGARTNWERDEQTELESIRRAFASIPADAGFDVEAHVATSARQMAQQRFAQVKNRVQSLNALLTTLAGVEGRKILILSSDRFAQYAGLEALQADFGPPPPDALEFSTHTLMRSLTSSANAAGFTIYGFHPRGVRDALPSAEFAVARSQGREYQLLLNDSAGLDELSKATGGLLAIGPADVRDSIARIREDLRSYYSIGYRSRSEPGKVKSLSVKVKREGLRVRSRNSVVQKTADEQMQDRVLANLFMKPDPAGQLGIRVSQGAVAQKNGRSLVPVQIEIPISDLTILPTGSGYEGSLSLYVASKDEYGAYSEVARQTQRFQIAEAELDHARRSHFTYQLEVASNGVLLSIAVLDDISRVSAFETIALPGSKRSPFRRPLVQSGQTPAEKRGDDLF